MQREAFVQAVQNYYLVLAGGSRSQVRALLTSDFQHHIAGLPEGFDGWWAMLEAFRGGFGSLAHVVDDVLIDGSRCAVRIASSGVHTGVFLGHPPSGRGFRSLGIEWLRFEQGLVAERWGSFDVVSMLRQLGLYVESGAVA